MDLAIPKKILRYRKAERCSDFYGADSSGTRKGWDCGYCLVPGDGIEPSRPITDPGF
jgi:hypothetical protein